MRTNQAGLSGRFSCDRCNQPSPGGVYTNQGGFAQVCPSCKHDVKGGFDQVSRVSKPRMAPSAATIAAMRAGRSKPRFEQQRFEQQV